jgi:hypothetical protein
MICHSWKVMFHAEYSSGQPLKMLADLRTVIEEALNRAQPAKAAAAVAGAPAGGPVRQNVAAVAPTRSKAAVQEFDISAGQHDEGDNA